MANVTLEHLYKQYDKTPTLQDINLSIANEEFIVLVGPSGCGKTTILRMIAGLEAISDGIIRIHDKVVNTLAPKDRDIAMVFQSYALYPHMSVYDNMAFGLKMRKTPKPLIKEKVTEAARILDLSHLLDRKPRQLSGGQRQRVALGRAIVRNPQVFLMDEPLSNLDAKLRVQMRMEILKLHRALKATTIYVTHDQTEAMTMGDRIVVLNAGMIQQVGPPETVYTQPANMFVGSFIGRMDFLPARLEHGRLHFTSGAIWPLPPHFIQTFPNAHQVQDLQLGMRPEHFAPHPNGHPISVVPEIIESLGPEKHVHFTLENQPITAALPQDYPVQEGHPVILTVSLEKCSYFNPVTQQNLLYAQ